MIISGASQSGKSSLVVELIRRRKEIIDPPLDNVLYMYACWQDKFTQLQKDVPEVQFHQGLIENSDDIPSNSLVIIDDLLTDLAKSEDSVNLFVRGSHHNNISVIGIVQSFFYKGLRNLTLQCKYVCLMKNPREQNFIRVLGSQMSNGKRNEVLDYAWRHTMNQPYGYVVIDFSQTQNNKYRIRNSLFPENMIVYCEND